MATKQYALKKKLKEIQYLTQQCAIMLEILLVIVWNSKKIG